MPAAIEKLPNVVNICMNEFPASSAVSRPPLGCSMAAETSWLSPPPALSTHAAAGRVSNKARGREP